MADGGFLWEQSTGQQGAEARWGEGPEQAAQRPPSSGLTLYLLHTEGLRAAKVGKQYCDKLHPDRPQLRPCPLSRGPFSGNE